MNSRSATIANLGEFGTLRRIWEIVGAPRGSVLVGLGDDAAIVEAPSRPVVLTVDAMQEGVHFLREWCGARDLAHKILASNLSDLAAKCASPRYALITLGLPGETPISWVEELYSELAILTKQWELDIVGGDLVKSDAISISLTAWGELVASTPIRIDTARPGDSLFVTGSLGDAASGLEILRNRLEPADDHHSWLIQRMLRPTPRVREALALAKLCTPTAMTDISDGLARDLRKLCAASCVGATIEATQLPCSDALCAFAQSDALRFAWNGGEDYELLFTLPRDEEERLLAEWDDRLAPITRIGRIVEGESICWQDGTCVEEGGFDHFG